MENKELKEKIIKELLLYYNNDYSFIIEDDEEILNKYSEELSNHLSSKLSEDIEVKWYKAQYDSETFQPKGKIIINVKNGLLIFEGSLTPSFSAP